MVALPLAAAEGTALAEGDEEDPDELLDDALGEGVTGLKLLQFPPPDVEVEEGRRLADAETLG